MHTCIESILLTAEISACQYKNIQLTIAFGFKTNGRKPSEVAFGFKTGGLKPPEAAFGIRTGGLKPAEAAFGFGTSGRKPAEAADGFRTNGTEQFEGAEGTKTGGAAFASSYFTSRLHDLIFATSRENSAAHKRRHPPPNQRLHRGRSTFAAMKKIGLISDTHGWWDEKYAEA